MAIDNYPSPEFGGPPYLKFRELDSDWSIVTTEQQMDDGSSDVNLEGDSPIRRWEFEYDGLTETQAAILDGHRAAAKGIAESFTFVNPRTGESLTGVKYESFETDHSKRWIQTRKVRLIRRP
jgi:hypothetical protein